MQNFWTFNPTIVAFSERQQNLHENFPYNIFSYEIFFIFAFFDKLGHIAIATMFHDNEYFLLVSMYNFFYIPDNIGVIKFAETIDFANNLGPLFFW